MTAAEQILDALKLVVGKDVNEYAIPVINTIIKNHESAQLSAKEQECEELKLWLSEERKSNKLLQEPLSEAEKRGHSKAKELYESELSSLRADIKELKEASEVDVLSAKGHSKNLSDEIERLRADNVTLQEKVRIYYQYRGSANRAAEEEIKSLTARLKGTENEILRKRCEDLESELTREKSRNIPVSAFKTPPTNEPN